MIKVDLTSDVPVQITCKRGDTFVFDGLDFFSDTAKTIPLDIASDAFKMQVKDDNDTVILSFTGGTNFVVSGTGNNHLKITATATAMVIDATPAGQPYKYDLHWTSASGVLTIMYGPFIVEQDVTDNA